jgi:hypothetical protein
MSIEGRIAVDVSFADSATSSSVQSLKKISLVDTTAYTSGKVAIASGTVGTAAQTLGLSSYRNAAGEEVTFSTANRVAFRSVGAEGRFLLTTSPFEFFGAVSNGNLAVSDIPDGFTSTAGYRVKTSGGTASYTIVLYGT